jgi:hypothetical protein
MIVDSVPALDLCLFSKKAVLYVGRNSLPRVGAVTAAADPAGPHMP